MSKLNEFRNKEMHVNTIYNIFLKNIEGLDDEPQIKKGRQHIALTGQTCITHTNFHRNFGHHYYSSKLN